MIFKVLSDTQRRIYVDAAQVFEAFVEAEDRARSYRGGMHWKKSKGREYLFRTIDRTGRGKSLGPRSPETELILARFQESKGAAEERLDGLRERLAEQARLCRAVQVQRVPRLVAAILRVLRRYELLGDRLLVVGTHALYAYEAAAGVLLDPMVTATMDLDLLLDSRKRLALVPPGNLRFQGLIELLRSVDRSFAVLGKGSYRAANRDGYMVDLIRPIPDPPWKSEPRRVVEAGGEALMAKDAGHELPGLGEEGDLTAADVGKLEWLLSSPKFEQIVIGDDGFPALMATTDPRAFLIHKLWLSNQEDREPVKKQRDRSQAAAVMALIAQFLPQYRLDAKDLRMFPREIVEAALAQQPAPSLPPDLG